MTQSKSINASNRRLVLLSAALLLQTGGALTAARAGDAQTQARELLSPTQTRSVAARSSAVADAGASLAGVDPQEQARRVLVSAPGSTGGVQATAQRYAKSTSPAETRHVHSDAQEMARQMILGRVI
ncbi:MAG TPA: hypothetical protein VKP66_00085 [Steroidobacteraceae bacterium]|nr:hypothetical protein [Steroidobacteraceae bacterium]